MRKINNHGEVSLGAIVLIVLVLGAAFYFNVGGVQNLVNKPSPSVNNPAAGNNCPSSGLTSVTINTQQALASTATASTGNYYIFDDQGVFVTSGTSTSAGVSAFDIACGTGKTYQAVVANFSTSSGFYPQTFTIDASKPTDVHSVKTYTYGNVNVVSLISAVDPTGGANVSSGVGRTCGWALTLTENKSVSAYNQPLILCQVNVSSVISVTADGVTAANSLGPSRITPTSGYTFYDFAIPGLLKSTDAAVKVTGKIRFSDTNTPANNDFMTCRVIDQATYLLANYQTLPYSGDFVQAGEDGQTKLDIGGPDSNVGTLGFNNTATSYC